MELTSIRAEVNPQNLQISASTSGRMASMIVVVYDAPSSSMCISPDLDR